MGVLVTPEAHSQAYPHGKVKRSVQEKSCAQGLTFPWGQTRRFASLNSLLMGATMIEFQLPDMTCSHCASMVTKALKQTDPDCVVSIDLKAQRVGVRSQENRQTLSDALFEAGYPPA